VEITEVRVKLMEEPGERLQAFCSITFDDAFVVRDLKIIEGASGPFVAMPSRKLTAHCPHCGCKNHLRGLYCNQCGGRLKEQPALKDEDGRAKLYADIAHPINSACREMIQKRVIQAYEDEKSRAKLPGYVPSYDDFGEEDAWASPSRMEPTSVQGAEKPRGPHKLPAGASQTRGNAPAATNHLRDNHVNEAFGAGIFD
jgi:stage V sporulation protein G